MNPTATECLYRLVDFAIAKGFVAPIDSSYNINLILEIM